MHKYKPSKNDAKPTLASATIIQCANEKEVEINIYIPGYTYIFSMEIYQLHS